MPFTHASLPDFGQPRIVFARARTGLMALILTWDFRHRSRCRLAHLPPHMLRDIGLDDISVHDEASKPFWKD